MPTKNGWAKPSEKPGQSCCLIFVLLFCVIMSYGLYKKHTDPVYKDTYCVENCPDDGITVEYCVKNEQGIDECSELP